MKRSLFAALLMILAALAACGGGGGDTATGGVTSPGTADVEGLWTGTYTAVGDPKVTVYGAIVKGGYAFFYDTKGILYVLPKLNGGTTVSGDITSYVPIGLHFSDDNSLQQTYHLTATASDTVIKGDYVGDGLDATFSIHPFTPYSGTPSVVAGDWQGFYVGSHSVALALTVHTNGNLAGSDSDGCVISGKITQIQPGEDIFRVTLTSTGGPLCYGEQKGLAFESSTDADGLFGHAAGTYYYMAVSSTAGGFIAALQVQ